MTRVLLLISEIDWTCFLYFNQPIDIFQALMHPDLRVFISRLFQSNFRYQFILLHWFSFVCLPIAMFNMVRRFFWCSSFIYCQRLAIFKVINTWNSSFYPFFFWMTKSDHDYSLLLIHCQEVHTAMVLLCNYLDHIDYNI